MLDKWWYRILRGVVVGFAFSQFMMVAWWTFGGSIEEICGSNTYDCGGPDNAANWLTWDWELTWWGFFPGAFLFAAFSPRPTGTTTMAKIAPFSRMLGIPLCIGWLAAVSADGVGKAPSAAVAFAIAPLLAMFLIELPHIRAAFGSTAE